MSGNEYIVGQPIELLDVVTDPHNNDALIDDPTNALTVYLPDGTVTTPVVATRDSLGNYSAVFTPTITGWHRYIFSASASATGKGRGRLYVSAP